MENSWHSYPKIYALGHPAISDLFSEEILIEEKVDGSQFSFGLFDGEIKIRSKGQEMDLSAPEKMFLKALEAVIQRRDLLRPGWTYRAEYLFKPKHNVLAYDRVPKDHLILFDINPGYETYLSYEEKRSEADRLALECVPLLAYGRIDSPGPLKKLLEHESCLGGQRIEGFVVKNYVRFGTDKKALMGKFVSESFKEVHKKEWKIANPSGVDFIAALCNQYRSVPRWQKSVQHLKEKGLLTHSPKDIGTLIKEAQIDIKAECEEEIKKALFAWAWPKIERAAIRGLPEWYKEELLKSQFERTE